MFSLNPVGSACTYSVGYYNLGIDTTTWAPRLANLTIPTTDVGINCSVDIVTYAGQVDLFDAVQSQQVDFVLTNPGLMVCLVTQLNVSLIAGFTNRYGNQSSSSYGGDVLVVSDSSIKDIESLKGKKVIGGPPYATGVYQMQARELITRGIDIYKDLSVLAFEDNQTLILQELQAGNFDAAFFRADQIINFETLGQSFTILNQRNSSAYPYNTSTDLYPEWTLAALPNVSNDIRSRVATQLLSLRQNQSGISLPIWTTPYNYFSHQLLQMSLGIMSANGTCLVASETDYDAYVVCPPGSIKLSKADIAKHCASFPQQCANRRCVCTPCFTPVKTLFFGFEAATFWPLVSGVSVFIILAGWLFQACFIVSSMIPEVSMQQLHFPRTPEVVGESRYGKIVQATLNIPGSRSRDVIIHRLCPSKDGALDSVIGESTTRSQNMTRRDIWKRTNDVCHISHPHLLRAHGVVRHEKELLLVSDYPEAGNLYDFINNETMKLDMSIALKILKEIALALQCLHTQKPPVTFQVTLYNVWFDSNRSAQVMLSDNFRPPSKSPVQDIFHFGVLMLHVSRKILPPSSAEPHVLQTSISDPVLLIRDCSSPEAMARPGIREVIIRLIRCQNRLEVENEKAMLSREKRLEQESLIVHSVFPRRIAEMLRANKPVLPEQYETVTILFTDIVGFTSISSRLTPMKVADMLDRLYTRFDRIAGEYSILKVETIGDSWMGVSNLESQHSDHAARMARFALKILDAANETIIDTGSESLETISIRVGIHCGPVVASVVGKLRPRYCLFGTTVNLSSRMESTSTPGRIQLSAAAAELIISQADDLTSKICRRLDPQDIKGKGVMTTYWLTSGNDV